MPQEIFRMKDLCFLISLTFIFQSCITVPGQYLSKHDPGFFTTKNDGAVQATLEQSGIKSGIKVGGSLALLDNFFVGFNAGVYKKVFLQKTYKMQGISVRPEFGYFNNFGKNKHLYIELHAGGGLQYNSYSIQPSYKNYILFDHSRPLQVFGGAFMGYRMDGKKFGFDVSYEHNFFNNPILKEDSGFIDGPGDVNPTEFISRSYNITTSYYIFKEFKNWDLYYNNGFNIGYTAFFVRVGAVWRIGI